MQPLSLSAITGDRSVKVGSKPMKHRPESNGARHFPMAHADFYRLIRKGLDEFSTVKQVEHGLLRHNTYYFGIAELEGAPTLAPVIGWRSTHNARFGAMLYVGVAIRPTNAFVFSHTISLGMMTSEFPKRLATVVASKRPEIIGALQDHGALLDQLRNVELDDRDAMYYINQLLRAEVLPLAKIAQAVAMWYGDYEPEDTKRPPPTAFRLYDIVARSYMLDRADGFIEALVDRSPLLMPFVRGWTNPQISARLSDQNASA